MRWFVNGNTPRGECDRLGPSERRMVSGLTLGTEPLSFLVTCSSAGWVGDLAAGNDAALHARCVFDSFSPVESLIFYTKLSLNSKYYYRPS